MLSKGYVHFLHSLCPRQSETPSFIPYEKLCSKDSGQKGGISIIYGLLLCTPSKLSHRVQLKRFQKRGREPRGTGTCLSLVSPSAGWHPGADRTPRTPLATPLGRSLQCPCPLLCENVHVLLYMNSLLVLCYTKKRFEKE